MHTSAFLRLFPPPSYMVMKHAGIEISDDAIRCLEYVPGPGGFKIKKYARQDLPVGIVEGGDIKDERAFLAALADFDKKHGLSYVKASLPEEKVYLFQTDVPSTNVHEIGQNIEFKLEENVPLSAADAIFYFDLLPMSVTGGVLRASVSVVPRTYVERYIDLLKSASMFPVAFEVVPKSIAHAVVSPQSETTELIIHIMDRKTGIYIVSGGVVCFTSTIGCGSQTDAAAVGGEYAAVIGREVNRVYAYWMSHGDVRSAIDRVVLVGHDALKREASFQGVIIDATVPVAVADVWRNSCALDRYVPAISREESLDYAVTAGLALPS